ncbi:MAG: NADH-quinone oxidoreductase subunit N [Opitutae bacterium]|nr:NADH-quinone oxidoreductase subunit N [Opitutae bacterium]
MNPSLLQQAAEAAANNSWVLITPEIMLGAIALLLLALELVLPKKHHELIPSISIAAQLGLFVALLVNRPIGLETEPFNGLLRLTGLGHCLRLYFLAASLLVSLLGAVALARRKLPRIEFFALVAVVTAALMLLAQANHFVLLFVALETATIGFYILVSYFRSSPLSLEAGLKYLVMGALSSAILLFGIVLLYGVAGNPQLAGHAADPLHFGALRHFLSANPDNLLASVGIVLVLSGVAFKIGAVPFQIWVPDVYQGAPTPVTAFLAVSSKAAGFAVLLVLTQEVFSPYQGLVLPLLGVMAGATILLGNIAALTQHNVKRLMGLSGVAHAGYLLLGIIAAFDDSARQLAVGAVLFYLVAYLLASMTVFAVMTHLAGEEDAEQELGHYTELAQQRPFLAWMLAIGLGSLAGIPPLAGFIGKLAIFVAAFKAGLYPLLAIAIVGVVLSIYYYFGWIRAAFFAPWRAAPQAGEAPVARMFAPAGLPLAFVLCLLAAGTLLLGLYQGALGQWLLAW